MDDSAGEVATGGGWDPAQLRIYAAKNRSPEFLERRIVVSNTNSQGYAGQNWQQRGEGGTNGVVDSPADNAHRYQPSRVTVQASAATCSTLFLSPPGSPRMGSQDSHTVPW